jgi:RNA polymerase sigma-70 factor (ECF subfamily)
MLTTQISLLARLTDSDNSVAWRTFIEIYQPVIYRSLRAKGLQHFDADDVTQQILMSVAKSLASRPHDPNRGRFRTWLSRVIRNAAINAMQRVYRDQAAGGSQALELMAILPDRSDESDESLFDREQQRQFFHHIAGLIQTEFEPSTWQAFWRTTVDGESIEKVAGELGKQVGSVYAARSRIMKRMRQEMDLLTQTEENP